MESPEIEIATLKAQYAEIKKALDEIKTAVTVLVGIKGEVAAQGQLQKVHDDRIKVAEERITAVRRDLQDQGSFISRLQGAYKLAAVLVGVVQALVFSAGGWAANTLINSREEISVLKQTVRYLEQQNADLAKLVVEKVK